MCVTGDQILTKLCQDDLSSAGVGWARWDVFWGYIETSRGVYDWRNLDAEIAAAESAGLRVCMVIQTMPTWLSGLTEVAVGPRNAAERQGYVDFCVALARRYGRRIGCYEIWNEPNLKMFWQRGGNGDPPSVASYLELLKLTQPAIKAVDPTLTVISAGLGGFGAAPDIDMRDWTTSFLAAGGEAWCPDGYGVHDYYEATAPLWNTSEVRKRFNQAGKDLPLWVTECGCPTQDDTSTWAAIGRPVTTEQGQIEVLSILPEKHRALSPLGGATIAYQWRDRITGERVDREAIHGTMRHSDGTPKPGVSGIRAAAVDAGMRTLRRRTV